MAVLNSFCKKFILKRHFSLLFKLCKEMRKNLEMFFKTKNLQKLENKANIWQPGTTLCCDITKGSFTELYIFAKNQYGKVSKSLHTCNS